MTEDGFTELAKLFKARDNKAPGSMTTGIVISPPPLAQIQFNDETTLFNHHLIWSAHMLLDVKQGDEVIIMPVADNQLYYVIGKAVRFE